MGEVGLEQLSDEDMVAHVRNILDMTQLVGTTWHFSGFGKDHNWVKKNIFWKLPYWSTLLVWHNFDVMHVEKNVFDNVFNIIMNIKSKIKDNENARLDLAILCKRPELERKYINGKSSKQKQLTYLEIDKLKKSACSWKSWNSYIATCPTLLVVWKLVNKKYMKWKVMIVMCSCRGYYPLHSMTCCQSLYGEHWPSWVNFSRRYMHRNSGYVMCKVLKVMWLQ